MSDPLRGDRKMHTARDRDARRCVYAGSVVGPAIVELARAAVRRLADAAPGADEARAALARIERVGLGPPYTVAVAGDRAARGELLDWLAGERLFAPDRPEPDRILVDLRRGSATSLRARRRDGSVEERTLASAPEPAESRAARRRAGRHDERVETVLALRAAAFDDAIDPSEAATRALERPPPWWAVWRWVARWWRAWRAGRGAPRLSAWAVSSAIAPGGLAPARRGFANTVARDKLPEAHENFVAALSACLADDAVERLFLEIAGGELSDKIVVIELPESANARALDAVGADACLVACGPRGFAMTDQLATALEVVPHLFAVGDGSPGRDPRVRQLAGFADAAARLVAIATVERTLAVGQQAVAALAAGSAALDTAITRAETSFRARLDRLEALRIGPADEHVAAALARIRPLLVGQVQQLLRRSIDLFDRAIAELGEGWNARLADAASTDALRATAAAIDDESPAALQTAQATAHRALVDGLTQRARAHYQELVGELRRGTSRDDPVPAWLTAEVEIAQLTSSTSLGAVAPRLASLFRSLDVLRSEALVQLDQRIARLRQLAGANLLDAEPRLEPAVTGVLGIALRGEVERHASWLDAELARQRIAIDAERAQIAALSLARDTARADERELSAALDAITAELP
jgi:hypothetical protein